VAEGRPCGLGHADGMVMQTKFRGLAAALACGISVMTLFGSIVRADATFPIVPAGESFEGQITIDPAGASASSVCCGGIIYTSTGSMGTISVTFAGVTFSGALYQI
jgi:hypothetical protein